MLQQLMASNRFITLAPDDPDDSDTDIEPTGPTITEKTGEDASVDSDHSVYFDALKTMRTLPTSNKELSLLQERSGKLPRLSISPMSRGSCK